MSPGVAFRLPVTFPPGKTTRRAGGQRLTLTSGWSSLSHPTPTPNRSRNIAPCIGLMSSARRTAPHQNRPESKVRLGQEAGQLRFNITTVKDLVGCVKRIWKWGVRRRGVSAERYHELMLTQWPKVGSARPPKVIEPADPEHVKATLWGCSNAPRQSIRQLPAAVYRGILALRAS